MDEIRNKLVGLKNIINAVLVVWEKEESKYIVAYYVPEREMRNEELESTLAKTLPKYMIPSHFIRMDSIPLTINGKINYKALPSPENREEIDLEAPQTEEEIALSQVWCQVLGINYVGINDKFFSLGGDSIKSIQICARLRSKGYKFSVKDILREQTIKNQARKLQKKEVEVDQSVIKGKGKLSPIQRWFVDGHIRNKHHYNQSVLLHFKEYLEADIVKKVFGKVLEHHDALRMVFRLDAEIPYCENKGAEMPLYLEEHDLRKEGEAGSKLSNLSNNLQSEIDLAKGPLVKLSLYHMEDGSRLLIVIHHLVVDAVSWRILLEDVERLYQLSKEHKQLNLPTKTTAFLQWSDHLEKYTQSERYRQALEYWDEFNTNGVGQISPEMHGKGTFDTIKEASFLLSKKETNLLLTEVHETFGTRANDILLTALLMSINRQFDLSSVLIDLENHGREEISELVDVNRTIGWFTSIYPVLLTKGNSLMHTIKLIKETLRSVPNNGIDYLLKYYYGVNKNLEDDNSNTSAKISFNYLGQFDEDIPNNVFSIASESTGEEIAPTEKLTYDWEIAGMVSSGQLKMYVHYSDKQYDATTMERLMFSYHDCLAEVIAYCHNTEIKELTPSDLTWSKISISQLDKLQRQYDIVDIYPLSPMQQGMLFFSVLDSEASHYFEQISYRIKGTLSIEAVKYSLNALIARHDALRTIFLHEGFENPIQVVLKKRQVNFNYIDIHEGVSYASREDVLKTYLENDKSYKFDLTSDVLMRVTILHTGQNEYEFIWSYHHVIMDGWCMSILIEEFNKFYLGHINNRSVHLGEAQPYSAYIQWLQDRSNDLSSTYWEYYLQGYDSIATLPAERKGFTDIKVPKMANETLELSIEQTNALREISAVQDVTLNTIVQVAWGILLSKYNHTEDVIFGSVVSGRPSEVEGIETMVGLFINTVPVRLRFDLKDTVQNLLAQTQNQAIESEPYHYHSLSEIQSGTHLGRNLLDHILIFENYPISEKVASDNSLGFKVEDVRIFEETNYDLFLEIYIQDNLTIEFNYRTNKYSKGEISRFKVHLEVIFNYIISHCRSAIGDIDILSEVERKQALVGMSRNGDSNLVKDTVLALFEAQAKAVPSNKAIIFAGGSMTYQELDVSSNKIASYLINAKAVKARNPVAVMLKRQAHLFPVVFGILKAGAVYVPIDPKAPAERLKAILRDAKIQLLIKNSDISFLDDQSIELIDLDVEFETIEQQSAEPLENKYTAKDPAYIIYTSGSTGTPKGVIVAHVSLLSLIRDLSHRYPLEERDVYLFKTPHIFDVSLSEMFGWFIHGGSLAILPHNEEKEPQKVVDAIHTFKVTHINFVPSFFSIFTEYLEQNKELLPSLKYCFVAGEAMPLPVAHKFLQLRMGCKLYNLYGPTEGTVYATTYEVIGKEKLSIPIGKPLSDVGVAILDRSGHPVPIGIPGELYITGQGLAAGYYNNKLLTEKSFGNILLGEVRAFKSGDLALLRKDGNIDFLGRIDNQVKIRGFRIEPGEIEYNLLEHKHIKEVVVMPKNWAGEKHLIAYYISEIEILPKELVSYLRDKLPEYMIPSFFVRLDKMPLTGSGKVDRERMPEVKLGTDKYYIAPSNEIENKLTDMYSEVLKIAREDISMNESFFALGGHSLKALNVINKVNRYYNIQISLQELFEEETIMNLAENIQTILQIQNGQETDSEGIKIVI